MGFIVKRDYFTEIRESDLDEILEQASQKTAQTPKRVRTENELNQQAIVETMLRHRYDVGKIFKDVLSYDAAVRFEISDTVEWNELAYNTNATYSQDDYVSHFKLAQEESRQVQTDFIYKAKEDITTPEDFDPAKWDIISENGSLYTVKQPTTGNRPDIAFVFSKNNFTGNHDLIQGWDKTKTIYLKRISGQVKIYDSIADRTNNAGSIGIVNFDPVAKVTFPDNRTIQQGDDIENSLSGVLSFTGFVPDNTEWNVIPTLFFTKEDNRDRTIKNILVNLAIANLHKLISPRNVPEMRIEAKDDAMMLLKKASKGEITLDLPLYEDTNRGQNVIFGSNRKRNWSTGSPSQNHQGR